MINDQTLKIKRCDAAKNLSKNKLCFCVCGLVFGYETIKVTTTKVLL